MIYKENLIRSSLEFFAFAKNRDDFYFFVASPSHLFYEIATVATLLRDDNDVDSSPSAQNDDAGLVLRWKIATSRLAPLLAMTEERADREKNFVLQYFRFGANAEAIRNFLKEK